MKIKNLAVIILMTILFIILGTKVFATTGKINQDTVKLRKKPDSKTVLDYVYKGDEVEIIELEEGWYKVKAKTELGKVTGYISEDEVNVDENISSKDVQEEQETSNKDEENIQPEKMETEETTSTEVVKEENIGNSVSTSIDENNQYTIEQEISIKALPLINSREKAKIIGNVTVIEIINDWTRIENDVESGWVRKNILKQSLAKIEIPVQEQPEEKPEENVVQETTTEEHANQEVTNESQDVAVSAELQKVGYVSTEGLRVRKGPTTDSEELHSLSKNDKVEIIGQEGKWYKIKLDEEIGYVSAKYISDTKVPETTSRSGSTLKNEITEQKQEEIKNVEETQKVEEIPVETTVQQSSTSRTTGTAVVEYAKQYLGYKYVSGGTSPSKGFDCSGFTQYVYKHFGISINRTSRDQIKNGVSVEKSNLQPGDLVLFNNDANTKIGHVGIYVGDGNFIHASNPSDGVKITTLESGYYAKRYVGARRVF